MKRILLLVICAAALLLNGCTRPDAARRMLEQNGYTNIEITGYSFFMCSDSDSFSTGFKAKAPNGRQVEGAVCDAFLKGATIRFK